MFNIGMGEMLLIGVLALILIGPKQIPEVARTLGRFINEIRNMIGSVSTDFKDMQIREMQEIKKAYESNRSKNQNVQVNQNTMEVQPIVESIQQVELEKSYFANANKKQDDKSSV